MSGAVPTAVKPSRIGRKRRAALLRPRHRSNEQALGVGIGAQGQPVEVGQRLVGQTKNAVLRHVQFDPGRCDHLRDERTHTKLDQLFGLIHALLPKRLGL
jgi:hypothetical protein